MKLTTLLPLTLTLWLTLAAPAFAKSGAYAAGKIFGFVVIAALIVFAIVFVTRRVGRRS